jgi:cytochrome c5
MQQKRLFVNLIFSIAFPVILVMMASCAHNPIPATQTDEPHDDQKVQVEHAASQVDARVHVPEVKEKAMIQETIAIDGRSILDNYCAQCHLVQSLLQTEKSRADWESALKQMEIMGVDLKETERSLLLDYLTNDREP